MPNSIKCKIKHLCHNGTINERERDRILKALEQESKWIPIKTRPLTKEEKEDFAEQGYSEDSIAFMYDCPLPDDGQEVLVTIWGGDLRIDTFCRDDGCYFETYCDEDDVLAWMPLPKPYKAESEVKNDCKHMRNTTQSN